MASFALTMLLTILVAAPSGLVYAQEGEEPEAVTAGDPNIPAGQLSVLLQPLTKDELLVEAGAWQDLVQEKAQEIAEADVMARQQAANMTAVEDAAAASEAAGEAVATAEQTLEGARSAGEAEAISAAEEALAEAQAELETATEAEAEASQLPVPTGRERTLLLEHLTELRDERTLLVDNLTAVIDDLFAKTHADDSDVQSQIRDYRLYVSNVTGLKVEVDDTASLWIAAKGWATSEQGGIRWAKNIVTVVVIIVLAWFVSRLISGAVRRALRTREQTSKILEDFLVGAVRWFVMGIGIIMALGAMEVSIGPLLAILGAAGFAIAFALQDSLGNIASGILILIFRPFDAGDVVDAGGVSGKVESLNLVSTTIKTFDNKRMIVPNNKVWNDVITNVTDVTTRRVDLEFGISYSDDVDRAAEILKEIVEAHDKVLKDPAPVVRLHALADSSVNFVCRPWVNADDYWGVYWDVMREVKLRFDAEGINIPFPQRDVHLYIKNGGGADVPAKVSGSGAASEGPVPQPKEIDDRDE
jgi:small conductance mechanosensitive channel